MGIFQEMLDLFQNRQNMFWTLLWEHIHMSLLALLCAVFISVPLGIYLSRKKRVAEPVIGAAAVLQTIPSLALLGFMILILNEIGTLPAVVALTAYALLPILRNTYTGISEVDPAIKEAATGMGMSSFRRLRKVELPMAIPVIMAGIRTSMVLIVGTATLAALISAGGLGDFIMTGIDRADNAYILLGAIPAALLALFFDFILRVTEKTSKGKALTPVAAVLGASLLVVAVPLFSFNQKPDLVIGGKMGAEPEIIANMYHHLIENETDLNVEVQSGFGSTDAAFNALQVDEIDIYPEFTGTAMAALLDQTASSGSTEEEVYERAAKGMAREYNMAYLEPMQFNNTYALAMREQQAQELDIETISDLGPYTDQLTPGFTFEFADRQDGYLGIQDVYGLTFENVETMDAGLRARALEAGEVDIIDAYFTSADIVEYNMRVLEDNENLFPPYQGAPLMKQKTLDAHPELDRILNQLSGEITNEEMQQMNYMVDYNDADPSIVAREYLTDNGFFD
ncbi:ABC transporter permease/substrate-binding protein [Salibacterium qingdaonense]|uniref:Osmoprotectant transport system permease protein n=1 Tax=Salibacterium qingdaonense TaxID=266892 RepID=A0A1I4K5I7_9BACI|nr:ABC transporter permease/substrate-binding protein [Salibacterium qingdaonense]SFL74004.1 osmoprotectant transport system permease protein [Salibacterium qingdaonense]